MNPEEFETEKRPRQESNVPVSLRLLPSLSFSRVRSGDNAGDKLQPILRILELWPKLAKSHQDLIADTAEALTNASKPAKSEGDSF